MKNPTPLYNCTSKLDACFLKNIIQRISCISVDIMKDHRQLMVDDCNYHKAKVILQNQLTLLPSVIAKKVVREIEKDIVEEKVVQYPQLDHHLISTKVLGGFVGYHI